MHRRRPGSSRFGRRSFQAISEPIISRFTANSLSTHNYRWLHTETWNDKHLEFFLQFRPNFATPVLAPLPYVSTRSRRSISPPELAGRWLLEAPIGGPLHAWVEAHAYISSFTTIHVLVSSYYPDPLAEPTKSLPESWMDRSEALALILSGLAIMTSADLMIVFPAGKAAEADLIQFSKGNWGTIKPIWSPTHELYALAHPDAPLGEKIQVLTIDPVTWWETDIGEKCKTTLAYLDKRTALAHRKQDATRPKKRRKSLIQKLLRWHY